MIEERAKKIKLLILDVDGVMTDGRIIYDNFGDELKCFNVNDGLGVMLLNEVGIKTIIITAKKSVVVKRRARDINIQSVYSDFNKLKIYNSVLRKFKVKDEEVCFIGDDIIDISVLKRVGLAVSPPNAVEDTKKIAHYITKKEGGKGAVREVIDIILKSKGLWEKAISEFDK